MKMETFQLFHFWQLHWRRDNLNKQHSEWRRWGGGSNCPQEIYGNGKEIKITNMLTNGSTSSHTSACRHVVIIIFPHNLISFDKKWDLQTCKNKMPVAQWAWKRAILLAPFYTSLRSCVLVYSCFRQERCGTANRWRRTFRKCQGWMLTQQQIEGWGWSTREEDNQVTLPTCRTWPDAEFIETNKEEILYQFLTGFFRLVRWWFEKKTTTKMQQQQQPKRVSHHSWTDVLLLILSTLNIY